MISSHRIPPIARNISLQEPFRKHFTWEEGGNRRITSNKKSTYKKEPNSVSETSGNLSLVEYLTENIQHIQKREICITNQ